MAIKVIGLSGLARSGKDTAAEFLIKELTSIGSVSKRYAFADELKRIAEYAGEPVLNAFNAHCESHGDQYSQISNENYYENKTEMSRAMLLFIGKVTSCVNKDYFISNVIQKISVDRIEYPVITDIRFKKEQSYLKDYYVNSFIHINIVNSRIDTSAKCYKDASETECLKFKYDYIIENNGTLEELELKMKDLAKRIAK